MEHKDIENDNVQILKQFRKVAGSYAELFKAAKDRIYHLLGPTQNYSSGLFREGLIRNFLSENLPQSVSVDSGFIYGFEEVENSKQLDIIIWDSIKHSAVYKTREFVIVPPESVIAAISVKSNMEANDIKDGLNNLFSITPLEFAYRDLEVTEKTIPLSLPITKFLVSFKGPSNQAKALQTISEFYQELVSKDRTITTRIVPMLRNINPFDPAKGDKVLIQKIFPTLVAAIESNEDSFLVGWGPPDDLFGQKTFGPGLRRLPYIYRQENKVTSPFEKLIYHLLASVYQTLGTLGWSVLSAWGDFNPISSVRTGDAHEVVESEGLPLIKPDALPFP